MVASVQVKGARLKLSQCWGRVVHVACLTGDRYHLSHMALIIRRETVTVDVGGVKVGSEHPIVVQSMTNTDTADADATAIQVARLAHAGSELVRVTVNNEGAAEAVPVQKITGRPGR